MMYIYRFSGKVTELGCWAGCLTFDNMFFFLISNLGRTFV